MKSLNYLAVLSILLTLPFLSAEILPDGQCVQAVVSDISPSSIGINEEFTVGIHIESCGSETPEEIYFEIIQPPTEITIKEELKKQKTKLEYSNSERFLTYHMKTTKDSQPGSYVIKTRLTYGNQNYTLEKDYTISFQVIADEAELNIASFKTKPVLPLKDETVELTLRVENTGDGTAKSVRVYADHPFKGVKQSFIGSLDPDEDGPAIFTFIADKEGEFEFPVKVFYKDDFGEHETQTNVNFVILKKEFNWTVLISLIIGIIILIWFIFKYYRIKNQKNRIIEQLLKGNGKKFEELEKETKREIIKETKKEKPQDKEKRIKEFKREILKKFKRGYKV